MKKLFKDRRNWLYVLFFACWTLTMARYIYEEDWRASILLLSVGVSWGTVLFLLSRLERYMKMVHELQETIKGYLGREADQAKTIFDLVSKARAKEVALAHGAVAVVGNPEILDRFIQTVAPEQRAAYHRVSDARDLESIRGLRLVKVIMLKGYDSVGRNWPGLINYLYSRMG